MKIKQALAEEMAAALAYIEETIREPGFTLTGESLAPLTAEQDYVREWLADLVARTDYLRMLP